jgi:Flp pilus assembly protein TadD
MVETRHGFIKVQHGKMVLNVPLSLFESGTARIRPEEAEKVRKRFQAQYPWLTNNAVEVILHSSEEEMVRIIDSEKPAAQRGREMIRSGEYQKALDWLEAYLFTEPEDVDAVYVKADVLFKLDRKDEGFIAMRQAQALAAKMAERGVGLRRK